MPGWFPCARSALNLESFHDASCEEWPSHHAGDCAGCSAPTNRLGKLEPRTAWGPAAAG